MREEFEQYFGGDKQRNELGDYISLPAILSWVMWQAATERAAAICEAEADSYAWDGSTACVRCAAAIRGTP